MSAKQLLRKSLRVVLDAVPRVEVDTQSKLVSNRLKPLMKPGVNVGCFMSMDQGEVETSYMLQWFFSQGNKVYLPRCTHTRDTGHAKLRDSHNRDHPHLVFLPIGSYDEVLQLKPEGKYQLKEPKEVTPAPFPPRLDVIIVPGVGFNVKDGSRIGWGAGYYDDFFKRYQLQHHGELPLLIGVSLKEQVTSHIHLEKHDYKMDCVITGDDKIFWFNKYKEL